MVSSLSSWRPHRSMADGPALQVPEAARNAAPVLCLGLRSVAALLVFERHLQLGAEQLDLAVLELHVLRRDGGHALLPGFDTGMVGRRRRSGEPEANTVA